MSNVIVQIIERRVSELDQFKEVLTESNVDEVAVQYIESGKYFKDALAVAFMFVRVDADNKDVVDTHWKSATEELVAPRVLMPKEDLLSLVKKQDSLEQVFDLIANVSDREEFDYYFYDTFGVTTNTPEVQFLTSTSLSNLLFADILRCEVQIYNIEKNL